MTDDTLTIQRCLDGHPHDYRLLVDRYAPSLRSQLLRDHPDHHLVEDTLQESLVRAYFNLPRLRKQEAFPAWLLGIARRVLKEQRRARRPRVEAPALIPAEPARAADPALEAAIAALPEPYRELILLRFYAGLTCPAIAQRLEVPLGTITKQLSRAYSLLREAMTPEHPEHPDHPATEEPGR